MAQKVNPDTLTPDQLYLYRHKAVKMRNAGIILASCGVSLVATGYIIGVNYNPTGTQDWTAVAIVGFSGMAGIATALAGVPLWAIGGSRKADAEFHLLNIDEYRVIAVTTRNTGMVLTLSGIGVAATGIIIYATSWEGNGAGLGVTAAMAGIASTIAGIPIWVAGANRMAKAELTLQKFNIVPQGSMALGLGITIRF